MMRPRKIIVSMVIMLLVVLAGVFSMPPVVASEESDAGCKIGGFLQLQVHLKTQSLQYGLAQERVDFLQALGVGTENLSMQSIFIHFAEKPSLSQVKELQDLGVILYQDFWIPPVGNHPTGFMAADMPIDKLNELASKDYVVRLTTAERPIEFYNDLAVEKMNADALWDLGYDGTGVRIAVLDSGLDVSHQDIPTPVHSKDYSYWPTPDDTIANTVTGHGTHVTGCALGRGTQSAGQYRGAAPDANLIFIKVIKDDWYLAAEEGLEAAIKDSVDIYNADIINISWGVLDEYYDGTSTVAQAVDYAFSQGAVVFAAAGNVANADLHYSSTVDASSTTEFIQVNVTGAGSNNTALLFNLVWFDGLGTSKDLDLEYYDSSYSPMSDIITEMQKDSPRGTESVISYYGPEEGSSYWLPPGDSTYYLKVRNNSASAQEFHIDFVGLGPVTFENPDPFYTIASPADADDAITVGSYTTRKYWWNYQGKKYSYAPGETVDTITSFSSRGPRVDGALKPNIVAPGSAIISVRDTDVYTYPNPNYDPAIIDNDGLNLNGSGPADYFVMGGTSFAAPHAAGATALLLERYPSLKGSPSDVRALLQETASKHATPDAMWGHGLIDIFGAFIAGDTPPTSPVVDVAPDSPLITDDITCTITSPSTDPDGDTVTYTYQWYKDDELQLSETTITTGLTDTVSSDLTAEDEVWRCVVTPNDGYADGPSDEDEVTIAAAQIPTIGYSPTSFTFFATEGGANPDDQILEIWNSSVDTLEWSVSDDAPWLTLDPPSGDSAGETDYVTLSVDITGMGTATYPATITISATSATNTPQTVLVELNIAPPPTIGHSPASFTFIATEGGANPDDQILEIWNDGVGTLEWSVSDDADWLTMNPPSGDSAGETDYVTLSVDISGRGIATYPATITISATLATNTPQTVPVELNIIGDDHGNSAEMATHITVGARVPGDIETDGDVDFFSFSAQAGAAYIVETALDTLSDSYLHLYDTDGITELTFDDNSGAGLASLIEWTAPSSGTYFIKVRGFGESDTGTYLLDLDGIFVSADGEAGVGVFAPTEALDAEGHPLEYVSIEPLPEPPAGAHVIGLAYDFGPDGATFVPPILIMILYDLPLPEGVAEEDLRIAYYDTGTGQWVELASEVNTQEHWVSAWVSDFTAFAIIGAPLTIGHSPTGFTFIATEGGANPDDQILEIWKSGDGTLEWSVSDDAPWLTMDPADGTSTGETDDVTLSVDITGMGTATYPATITISATSATNTPQTVPVELHIIGDDHGNSAETATHITVGAHVPGDVETDGDVDFCSFSAHAGATYIIETALDTLSDSYLHLYDTDGITELAWNDDIDFTGGNLASLIEWTAPSSGTYFIKVRGFGESDTGTYLLDLDGIFVSADGEAGVRVFAPTEALDAEGHPLEYVSIEPLSEEETPDPPASAHVIGLAYDFGPDGATFVPPILVMILYDLPLPEGVAEEDLRIAYYDTGTGQWVELDSEVDTDLHIVSAWVSHFTAFAVYRPAPPPPPPPPPPRDGGGGGAGGGPTPRGPELEVDMMGRVASGSITEDGELEETIHVTCRDGVVTLCLHEGTAVLDSEGNCLEEITVDPVLEAPALPEKWYVIGTAYDFSPDGATFYGSVELTICCDPEELPEGVNEEDLVIAFYHADSEEWRFLEPSVVDTGEHTVTGSIGHLTVFAVIGREDAAFDFANLSISPDMVDSEEPVTISIEVTNTGGMEGSYIVTLLIDGVEEATHERTLEPVASDTVTFATTREAAGTYSVEIHGLTGEFTVKEDLFPWALVGGIMGGVVNLLVVAAIVWYLVVRKRRRAAA